MRPFSLQFSLNFTLKVELHEFMAIYLVTTIPYIVCVTFRHKIEFQKFNPQEFQGKLYTITNSLKY